MISCEPAPDSSTDGHTSVGRDEDRHGRLRVFSLCAVTLAVAIPATLLLPHADRAVNPWMLGLVGLLILLAEIFAVDIEFRRESLVLSFSSAPTIIGLMILPPTTVLALRLLISVAIFVGVQRQAGFKVVANLTSHTLDLLVMAWILELGAHDHAEGLGSWWRIIAAGAAGDIAVALFIVAVIAVFQGGWDRTLLSGFWYGIVMAVVSSLVAIVGVHFLLEDDPAFIFVVTLTGFLVFVTRAFARVSARYQRLELLDRFSRVMGEAVVDGSVEHRLLVEAAEILHAERALLITRSGDSVVINELVEGSLRSRLDESFGSFMFDHVEACGVLFEKGGKYERGLEAAGMAEAMASRLIRFGAAEHLLVVADRSGAVRSFDKGDLAVFETLAVHAGLCLQNVGLVNQLRQEIAASEHLATHDALTGLPNRTLFQRRLDAEVALAGPTVVLLIDLDRFKEVNDTLGHHNGDRLLVQVGQRMQTRLGAAATVSRLGGDEFAVLLGHCRSEVEAVEIARDLVSALEAPFDLADLAVEAGGSVGVSVSISGQLDGPTMLRQADVAMYSAKAQRSGVEVYSPDRDHYSPQRLALVGKLRRAIDDHELELYYQPQVDLGTGEMVGAEALIRWPQPDRAPIPPDDFLHIAEHTGLIRPLTQLVLRDAVCQAARWRAEGNGVRVSVNLSAHNLAEKGLADDVAGLLSEFDLPPDQVRLELTESTVMTNPKRCVAMMNALRDIGVSISIDDFGTGQSSLAYLTTLPATEMKIDKSFVFALGTEPAADTVVRSIIDLGRNLGLEIVAEGVETPLHASMLREMGCQIAQGYLFSRPLAVRGFDLWRDDSERFHRFPEAPARMQLAARKVV
jgi:diguanylate cyclase (GGDEF)-like protein